MRVKVKEKVKVEAKVTVKVRKEIGSVWLRGHAFRLPAFELTPTASGTCWSSAERNISTSCTKAEETTT